MTTGHKKCSNLERLRYEHGTRTRQLYDREIRRNWIPQRVKVGQMTRDTTMYFEHLNKGNFNSIRIFTFWEYRYFQ